MTGKNILKEQLKPGTIDMPSVTGALKDSGAVTLDLSSIEERPKETIVSMSDEAETGQKMDGNSEKGTCHSRDETRKSHLPQDDFEQDVRVITGKKVLKQQTKTSKVNMPSVSGALKKSGEVRIVVASVHEPPEKTRGSSTKEIEGGGMKEGSDDKVTSNTGEELEKSLLPQDDFQGKMQVMTGETVLKQQPQTGNVNKPPVSGALKKEKAVGFDLASIEVHPKKTSGPRIKETEV